MKPLLALLLSIATPCFAQPVITPAFINPTNFPGVPGMAYPQPANHPPPLPIHTNSAELRRIAPAVLSAKCPKCGNTTPRIDAIIANNKGGFRFDFKCTSCKASPKWSTNTVAKVVQLPPALPAPKSIAKFDPTTKAPPTKVLTERRPSIGFVKKVPFPPIPRHTVRNIQPAAIGSVGPAEVAFHGPPYILTFLAPYRIQFLYSDYYLEAGRTYQFQEKNSVTGAWENTMDPYTAAGDEVYAKAPAAFNVNEAFVPFGTSRMLVVGP